MKQNRSKLEQYAVGILFAVFVAWFFYFFLVGADKLQTQQKEIESSCTIYADTPVKDVPLKCLKLLNNI